MIMSVIMSQSDRWLLSAMHEWDFLAQYDVANRLGLLSIGLVMALLSGLVAEARISVIGGLRAVAHRMIRLSLALMLVGSCLTVLSVMALSAVGVLSPSPIFWWSLSATLLWSTISVITGPITLLLTGIGDPGRELLYVIPAMLTTTVGWFVAIHVHRPSWIVASLFISIVIWSCVFVWYGLRHLERVDAGATQSSATHLSKVNLE